MSTNGATPDREDVTVAENSDPCIRFVKEPNEEGELVPTKKRMGKHHWEWEDLLKMRVCTTCGERRPFTKRFEGQ